jgi:Ca-activated chloride channel family protein
MVSMSRTSRTIACSFAIACFIASLGRAQEDRSSANPSRPVFRSAVELVALNVTVLDEHKRFIGDLGRSDFLLYENGVLQELSFFGLADVPVDLALLLDLSASMSNQMDLVRKAAIGLLRSLRPGDRAMVIGFSGRVHVLQALTANIGDLEHAVREAQPAGHTVLYDAVYVVLAELRRQRHASSDIRRQVAVVLTDGWILRALPAVTMCSRPRDVAG